VANTLAYQLAVFITVALSFAKYAPVVQVVRLLFLIVIDAIKSKLERLSQAKFFYPVWY
jgi:hypothetical protein